jgi:hypothetical protein
MDHRRLRPIPQTRTRLAELDRALFLEVVVSEPIKSLKEMAGDKPLLGYVAHVCRGRQFRGGLLIVDLDGDPVDFAHTRPVSIEPLSQTLFGDRFGGYFSKAIARPLLRAVKHAPNVLCFDDFGLLNRTLSLPVAVALLAPPRVVMPGRWTAMDIAPAREQNGVWCAADGSERAVKPILQAACRRFIPFTLGEPFARVRKALSEVVGEERV